MVTAKRPGKEIPGLRKALLAGVGEAPLKLLQGLHVLDQSAAFHIRENHGEVMALIALAV